MFGGILTGTTCGLPCWYAREEVCRCSCGGANHSIMTAEGATQPERQRKVRSVVYRLVAVTTYSEASDMVRDDYGSWLKKVGYASGRMYPTERMIHNKATPSQEKWAEVAAVQLDPNAHWTERDKYLVWERTDIARTR